MSAPIHPPLFSLDTLIAHLLDHRRRHPEQGGWNVEMHDHLLAAPPQHLTHDDRDQVVILLGIPGR